MARDPRDFGDVPRPNSKFKAPDKFPSDKTAMLKLVESKGGFPPRAARWLAPREVRALLTDDYPVESSTILAVRSPRQIKSPEDFLTLAADRRVAYTAELKAREKTKAPKAAAKG